MDDYADKRVRRDDATVAAERPEPAAPGDIDDAAADDFAARNVLMSNAFGGGASPFAGALIGENASRVDVNGSCGDSARPRHGCPALEAIGGG
jgi:hypothetical protein